MSLPCVKGGGTACRDGGIVKGENLSLNNPSAALGVSSLYTREPIAVFARLHTIPFIKLSLRTRRIAPSFFVLLSLLRKEEEQRDELS